jgi:hypothetical protein
MRVLQGAGLAAVLCLACLAGCGGTGQAEVEGTVLYDGQPIKGGSIAFLPAGTDQGRAGGGTILDGRYHIPAKFGPLPGRYRVEIRWAKPTGRQFISETGHTLDVTEEGLPEKYNDKSELTAELKSGKNTVNFDLKK